jgi:putative acetyltransferase
MGYSDRPDSRMETLELGRMASLDSDVRFRRIEAGDEDGLALIRELFREYEQSIGISLCFQGFEQELANLPGRYSSPTGALLVLYAGDEVAGCGAFRPDEGACELKRIYVRNAYRSRGLGRQISEELIGRARYAGYKTAKLDTLTTMGPAIKLYQSLGFSETRRAEENGLPPIIYMQRSL